MKRAVAIGAQASILLFLSLSLIFGWRHYTGRFLPTVEYDGGSYRENDLSPPSQSIESNIEEYNTKETTRPSTALEYPLPSSTTDRTAAYQAAESSAKGNMNTSGQSGGPRYIDDTMSYRNAIMDPEDSHFPRLSCPPPGFARYDYLQGQDHPSTFPLSKPKYFFALDLHNCSSILPRLLGSILETIRFLGPENCVLSIVEGRSTDGTFEILSDLRVDLEPIGLQYFLTTNDINPTANEVDRIEALAELRNQALLPLTEQPQNFDDATVVVFINDVALCMEDILELIHQRIYQKADMTCAMDWIFGGWSFYDVWISRTIKGELFFEIPQSGTWDFADKLFWDDPETKSRLNAGRPFQVFSCWNGATVFPAKPILQGQIHFRSKFANECLLGEPLHFCKDLWYHGYNRIAVVPTINIGYNDEESQKIKAAHGAVSTWLQRQGTTNMPELIEWRDTPPELIKCVPSWSNPSWIPWDEGLNSSAIGN